MNISSEYLAGLIDGEGYFGLIPHYQIPHTYHVKFKMALRFDSGYILEEIHAAYGGNLERRKGTGNSNDSLCLTIGGKKNVRKLLDDVLPFLILKKDIATLVYEYASMPNIHPLYRKNYVELDARRSEIVRITKAMTGRGKRVATTE